MLSSIKTYLTVGIMVHGLLEIRIIFTLFSSL